MGKVIIFPTAHPEKDSFQTRSARLKVYGKAFKDFDFKVQIEFSKKAKLKDGWIGLKRDNFQIKLGQFKQPFGLEDLTSSRFIDFPERFEINRFVPKRDLGILVGGEFFDERISFVSSLYNGSGANRKDQDNYKDLCIRVKIAPFKQKDNIFKKLQIGFSTTIGRRDEFETMDIETLDTLTKFLDFSEEALYEGKYNRLGVDLAWLWGPGSIKMEWMRADFGLAKGTLRSSADMKGWYISTTCWLTKEEETFKRPKIRSPLFKQGGFGGIEIALRYGVVRLNKKIFRLEFANGAERLESAELGINWWANNHLRISLAYILNQYAQKIIQLDDNRRKDEESALLFRFQLDF
jgi:phosphate-selective porin OprO/OprP